MINDITAFPGLSIYVHLYEMVTITPSPLSHDREGGSRRTVSVNAACTSHVLSDYVLTK